MYALVRHPHDDRVSLGGVVSVPRAAGLGIDTVLSLCRLGSEAAAAVERFRAEGKTVLLHCVRAESRTPTVAALYGARVAVITPLQALKDLRPVLPGANPNPLFLRLLDEASTGCTDIATPSEESALKSINSRWGRND